MAILYFPNGVQPEAWEIATKTESMPLPEKFPISLEPLEAFRKDICIVGGLTVDGGRAKGDGPGDHGRAGASYLTGVHPKKTFGKDLEAGESMDQHAARALNGATRFASLELGTEEGIQGGNCDNGYSCAYSNSISWRTPNTPNPPEIRPRAVFERLFGAGEVERDPRVRARIRSMKPAFSIPSSPTPNVSQAPSAPLTAARSTSTCPRFATSKPASNLPRSTTQPKSFRPSTRLPTAFPRTMFSIPTSCST